MVQLGYREEGLKPNLPYRFLDNQTPVIKSGSLVKPQFSVSCVVWPHCTEGSLRKIQHYPQARVFTTQWLGVLWHPMSVVSFTGLLVYSVHEARRLLLTYFAQSCSLSTTHLTNKSPFLTLSILIRASLLVDGELGGWCSCCSHLGVWVCQWEHRPRVGILQRPRSMPKL